MRRFYQEYHYVGSKMNKDNLKAYLAITSLSFSLLRFSLAAITILTIYLSFYQPFSLLLYIQMHSLVYGLSQLLLKKNTVGYIELSRRNKFV